MQTPGSGSSCGPGTTGRYGTSPSSWDQIPKIWCGYVKFNYKCFLRSTVQCMLLCSGLRPERDHRPEHRRPRLRAGPAGRRRAQVGPAHLPNLPRHQLHGRAPHGGGRQGGEGQGQAGDGQGRVPDRDRGGRSRDIREVKRALPHFLISNIFINNLIFFPFKTRAVREQRADGHPVALAIVDHISSTSAIRWPVAKITRQDVVELPIFLIAALAKLPLPLTNAGS